jgi:hypothetical protein
METTLNPADHHGMAPAPCLCSTKSEPGSDLGTVAEDIRPVEAAILAAVRADSAPAFLLARMTRLAAKLVELADREGPESIPARVQLRGAGILVTVAVDPASQAPAAQRSGPAPEPEDAGKMSTVEECILEALERHPHEVLTGPQVGRLAGYPYGTMLKTALAALRRRGVIVNEAPGYRLNPNRPGRGCG